eukprot:96101-Rhodomonas_salina.2
MSGIELRHQPRPCYAMSGAAIMLCTRYAMSGTDMHSLSGFQAIEAKLRELGLARFEIPTKVRNQRQNSLSLVHFVRPRPRLVFDRALCEIKAVLAAPRLFGTPQRCACVHVARVQTTSYALAEVKHRKRFLVSNVFCTEQVGSGVRVRPAGQVYCTETVACTWCGTVQVGVDDAIWTPETGLVTASMKVQRAPLREHYNKSVLLAPLVPAVRAWYQRDPY